MYEVIRNIQNSPFQAEEGLFCTVEENPGGRIFIPEVLTDTVQNSCSFLVSFNTFQNASHHDRVDSQPLGMKA